MVSTGTLNRPPAESPVRPPNRVAQAAAVSIAESEARARVLASVPAPVPSAAPAPAAPALHQGPAEVVPAAATTGLEDIDLTGAPALRPMKTLRVHERTKVLAECLRLAKRFDDREVDAAAGLGDLDPDVLELFGEVDLFMEKQVVDPEAYREWSTEIEGMDALLRVMGLFGKFTERLGG